MSDDNLKDFAQKIAVVFYQRGLEKFKENESANHPSMKKGVHLPFGPSNKHLNALSNLELDKALRDVDNKNGPVRISYKICTDYLFNRRLEDASHNELFEAAIEAHKCCQSQDLHLLAFKQLLLENGLSIRQIKDWKFPESSIAKKQIDALVKHLGAFAEEIRNSHSVKSLQKKDDSKEPFLKKNPYYPNL